MRFKRLFAGLTSMALCFSMLTALPANAEEAPQGESGASLSNDDISVKGTNSFGNMLAGALDEKAAEQTEGTGCNVFSVAIDGLTATVELQTTEDCTLIVALYEDDGVKMLNSAMTEVKADDTVAEVYFDDYLPEHYYLRAFLVDSTLFRPLSPVHTDPMHTAEMQDFLSKTTDDFKSDRVLNFDDDKTNNFAVYNDKVVLLESSDGTLTSSDESAMTYVFENAGSDIKNLKQGDIFSYGPIDDVLIASVDNIEINGDTVTIHGADREMDEVFDYIKIDTDECKNEPTELPQFPEGEVEGVEFLGFGDAISSPEALITNKSVTTYGEDCMVVDKKVNAYDIDEEYKYKISFKIEFPKDKDKPDSDNLENEDETKLKVSATLVFGINAGFKFYSSVLKNLHYVQFSNEKSISVIGTISLNRKVTIPLVPTAIKIPTTVPGLTIDVTPSLVAEGEIKADFTYSTSQKNVIKFSNKEGFEKYDYRPKQDVNIKVSGTLFIGLEVEISLVFIDKKICSIGVTFKLGGELELELQTMSVTNGGERHTCQQCLKGELCGKISLGYKIKLLNLKWLTVSGDFFEIKIPPVLQFYYSFDHHKFDWGECPYKDYYFTIQTFIDKDPESNTTVTLTDIKNGTTYSGKTDKNGYYSVFVPEGTYNIIAEHGHYKYFKKEYEISEPKAIKAVLKDYYNIRGKVAYNLDKTSIENAYVKIFNTDYDLVDEDQPYTMYTDADGYFSCNASSPGTYRILVCYSNYDDVQMDITIKEYQFFTELPTIYMKKPGTELKTDDIIGGFGTHRYKVVNGEFTWNEAKALCESVGGHLATITSAEEQEFVSRFVHRQAGSPHYWLGASDAANEGTWTWVTGEPFSYQNWEDGEPNDDYYSAEDYLGFWHCYSALHYVNEVVVEDPDVYDYDFVSFSWNDFRDEEAGGFICEWDNKANVGKSVITNGHRYEIIDTGLTWESAKAACEAKGGHLATITSQEEQNAIEVLLGNGHKNNYWLGGKVPEDTVIWITGEESDYTNFGSGQPDKYIPDEDKLMIWRIDSEYSEANRWNDLRSDGTCEDIDFVGLSNFGYICEWDNVGKTETLNKSSKTANTRSAKAEPDAAVVTHALKTAPNALGEPPFADLLPNTVYNVYAMRDTADGLTSYNLMYINQFTTDEDGKLTFDYGLKEDTDVQWIAVPFKSGNTEGLAEVTVIPAFAPNEERIYTDVTLTVDGKTFTADSTGKITITGLADGTYEAVISKPNYASVNVTITVGGENADVTIYKYGDADKNGKVDQSDLALMQKQIAGWNVTVDKSIADVTHDGKVNGEDIALMQKYFAGWNVTLGKVS